MNQDSLLLINDVTGYGRVSTFAMLPILSQYGIHSYVLPTALVSNTMDYGSAEILDTTAFMQNTINKWNEFGFTFKNISTGLINSQEQAEIILKFISSLDNPFVIVDPIMADDGVLYPDMYPGAIECNRKLASIADVLIPNITEATMLADLYVGKTSFTDNEYLEILNQLSSLGPKQIVITGCSTDNQHFNIIYDVNNSSYIKEPFEYVNDKFIGTGDVFSACLAAELIKGSQLNTAVRKAAQNVKIIVNNNKDNVDHYDIDIESSLKEIK